MAPAALNTLLMTAECTIALASWLIPTLPLALGSDTISPSTAVPWLRQPRSAIGVPPISAMPAGRSSCARFQLPSISQMVTPLPLAPARLHTSAAPMPSGGVYRYPCAGSKLRLPAADPAAIAGTGRGATTAFHTALRRFNSAAIRVASRLRFGTTCTKPLWMNLVSMPFFAKRAGDGASGNLAATSGRAWIAADFRPKWERTASMSNLSSTWLSESACGVAAAGATNFERVKATGLS
jgi:hypothetical protein